MNVTHRPMFAHEMPTENDVFICWLCYTPAILTDEGVLRRPTVAEKIGLDRDPRIQRAILAMEVSDTPSEAIERARELDR